MTHKNKRTNKTVFVNNTSLTKCAIQLLFNDTIVLETLVTCLLEHLIQKYSVFSTSVSEWQQYSKGPTDLLVKCETHRTSSPTDGLVVSASLVAKCGVIHATLSHTWRNWIKRKTKNHSPPHFRHWLSRYIGRRNLQTLLCSYSPEVQDDTAGLDWQSFGLILRVLSGQNGQNTRGTGCGPELFLSTTVRSKI